MAVDRDQVMRVLAGVSHPGGGDLISRDLIRAMTVDEGVVRFVIEAATPDEAAELVRWVDEVAAWPDDGEWMHHREMTDAGPALCRTENFTPFHEGLHALLTAGSMLVWFRRKGWL